jgi:hypothetical protein
MTGARVDAEVRTPDAAARPGEVAKLVARSPRLRLFEAEGGWIAYHGLFMRPMAMGKDVVKVLEWLGRPRAFPEGFRGDARLMALHERLEARRFLAAPDADELGQWISELLPRGHLRPPVRALLDGWASMDRGEEAMRALRPFIEDAPSPFAVVVRESDEPLDWASVARFLEAQAEREPHFEWLTFVFIASGRGLTKPLLRSLLPYNFGVIVRTRPAELEAGIAAAALLREGRAKHVLGRPFESLFRDPPGELQAMAQGKVTDVLAEVSGGSERELAADGAAPRAGALLGAAASAGIRLLGPWDGPLENLKSGRAPERSFARVEITSDLRLLLQGKDLGACAALTPELLDAELESTRLTFAVERCRSCPILGICPGESALRPDLAGGASCDIAIGLVEQRLITMLHSTPARLPSGSPAPGGAP